MVCKVKKNDLPTSDSAHPVNIVACHFTGILKNLIFIKETFKEVDMTRRERIVLASL